MNKVLERAGFENKEPIYDSKRMIVEEGHLALKDEMMETIFSTRRHLAPYGREEVELRRAGQKLDAAGAFYVPLTEYEAMDPATPSPQSVDTPVDKKSLPVEGRFEDALKRDGAEEGDGEEIVETFSEAEEEMEIGVTPNEEVVPETLVPAPRASCCTT